MRHFPKLLLLACIATGLCAPASLRSQTDASGIVPGTESWDDAKAVDGSKRFNVTFKKRSFDLSEFREAVFGNEPVEIVDAIVAKLRNKAREDQKAFGLAVEKLGGRVVIHFWLINAATIEIAPALIGRVRAMGNVLFARPDLPAEPLSPGMLPFIKTATDRNHHNADAEFARGNTGKGLGVAIIDTSQADFTNGPNKPHRTYFPLGNKLLNGGGIGGSRLLGNFKIGAQAANHRHPHGTGVASIAAGGKWGTSGADHGHAPEAGIIGYSICNNSRTCSTSLSTEAAAWQRVAADKVRFGIVSGNMSYGSSPDPTNVAQRAIDAVAINADVLPVTAAGNSGSRTTGSSSTANGLAVAATNAAKTVASFSSRGPLSGDTQRFFPDIAAHGVSTRMARNTSDNSDYVASGTSMASPQVCGAACLVKGANNKLSALQIKALLLATTQNIQAQNPGRNRNSFGMGYLRDDLACNQARRGTLASQTAQLRSTTAGICHRISVVQGKTYNVVVSWYRHVLTAKNWSDVNIHVLNGSSIIASSLDPRNLYEKVTFRAPLTGILTVEVTAKSLEKNPLTYAIATDATLVGTGSSCAPSGCRVTATFTHYGKGCKGSGQVASSCVVLPSAFATRWGTSSNTFPLGRANMRYQQVFRGSEAGAAASYLGVSLRQDDRATGRTGGTQTYTITMGYTTRNETNLSTSFNSNFNAGNKRVVFNGNFNMPTLIGTNKNLKNFNVAIKFSTPWVYIPANGRNILIEFLNRSTRSVTQFLDAASGAGATTTRVYAFNASATTATAILRNYGLVMCFRKAGGTGAIPLLSNTALPKLGGSYSVNLSQAKPNTIAVFFLGLSRRNWSIITLPFDLGPFGAPGCSVLASGDFSMGLPVNSSGQASFLAPVPNDKRICGASLYYQYLVFDPRANRFGLVSSNGGQATHGL